MNTILVTKDTWNEELKEVLTRNDLGPIHTARALGMVESKLSGKKNVVIYEMEGDITDEMAQLRDLMKEANRDRVKVLLILDQGIKDAITTLVKYENVKFIFKPLTKERLQIGLRMLMAEKKQAPKINIEYINPFIESTRMVLKQMAFTEIEKKEVAAEAGLRVHGDLSGVMALSGKANGFVVISMGSDVAFELVKRMTQGNVREDEERIVESGVMEIINIISGQAQSMFNQNQYHFDFTTPTMIKGKGHQIYHGQLANSIVVRFETDLKKDIYLQVCLKNS
jgi:chemotaxis protein CheX